MINVRDIFYGSRKVIHDNAPAILTAIGVSGTITTAYLAAKAGIAANKRLSELPPDIPPTEKLEVVWDLYIPTVVSGSITIGCIIIASRVSSKRAAAAYSILAVSERAFEEYREKVIETFGERKEQKVKDDVAQDRVTSNPPAVVIGGDSGVLCCELFTGRYFRSDMETLRRVQNDINEQIIMRLYVPMSEFYYALKLPNTSQSGVMGWDSDRLLELEFTTTLSPDNVPCLAFDYNYVKAI